MTSDELLRSLMGTSDEGVVVIRYNHEGALEAHTNVTLEKCVFMFEFIKFGILSNAMPNLNKHLTSDK